MTISLTCQDLRLWYIECPETNRVERLPEAHPPRGRTRARGPIMGGSSRARRGRIRGGSLWVVVSLALLLAAMACRENGGAGAREEAPGTTPGTASTFVTREVWLALVEEPKRYLESARSLFQEGDYDMASLELAKVAALLDFESPHSPSAREEALLLNSVEELHRVARSLRSQEGPEDGPLSLTQLDRVEAMALRSIAAHQVALARDALEAGDARMAGALSREGAQAIEAGFQRLGVEPDPVLGRELGWAREVGRRMEVDGEGTRAEALAALDDLDAAVAELKLSLAGSG